MFLNTYRFPVSFAFRQGLTNVTISGSTIYTFRMCIPAALILKSTSTPANQTAVGVGELVKRWTHHGRNCFAYKTSSPIPFRFALSSAQYAIKKEQYKGKLFEIYYHPSHDENVDHLLKNTRLTMDYCEKNYGPYPFRTIRFAEISSFTKGFAATAYPATVS